MSIYLAVGTTVSIAASYGATKTMSVLSNAVEAVATLEASHGVVENNIIEITSGWQRLTNRVVRADSVSTNDVTLEDIDTSSTSLYPAGTGTGSIREILTWTQIGQLTKDIQVTGGDQQFADITTLDDVVDQEIPTRRSPIRVTLPLFYDPALAFVATVRTAAQTTALTAVRFVYPSGAVLYANAYWSMLDIPTIENDTLRGRIDLALRGLTTLYTS
jgi:hypothetical protein